MNEYELTDDYPVNKEFFYVADGNVLRSPVSGTVEDLKFAVGASTVTNCDLAAREMLHLIRMSEDDLGTLLAAEEEDEE